MHETEKHPDDFVVLYPAKLLNQDDGTVLECYDEKGRMFEYILALKSHPCVFLDGQTNKCEIHINAPLVCRLYPYNSNGKMFDQARCTLIGNLLFKISGSDKSLREYKNQIKKYKELVSEWNRKHGSKEECLKFLLELSTKSSIL